jgi:hypothetical protein
MAPHSQYAPLHLVPKMFNDPSPTALDSRGAFIVHVLSSIYVRVGMKYDPVMEKDAKADAFQVVRHEKVQGAHQGCERRFEATGVLGCIIKYAA